MSLRFFIFQTRLQNETKYFGRVMIKDTCNKEKLVDMMLQRGTSMTKTDIGAVLNLLATVVAQLCREGYKVNIDDFLQITPAMGGTFTGKEDVFDPVRNELYLTAQVSQRFNKEFATNTSVERVQLDENRPVLSRVEDRASTTGNLVKGHIIVISGLRLKFDPTSEEESLVLVNADDSNQKVKITEFHQLGDRELVFLLPEVNFAKGVFVLTSGLGTQTLRRGESKPVTFDVASLTASAT